MCSTLQDADSLDKAGKSLEGAFYLWSKAEVAEVLTPQEAAVAIPYYYIQWVACPF